MLVPNIPTATYNEDEEDVLSDEEDVLSDEEVLLPSLLFFAQEMTVKLKRNREKMMSRCFTRFPISGLGEPHI